MRISHTQLESCLANPRSWYRTAIAAESHPYLMGYDRVLRLSIFRFHHASERAARDYMTQMVRRHAFKNAQRVHEIEASLERYIAWASAEGLRVADTNVNIACEIGFLELRGQISRVDVTATGYRAVLLGEVPADWHSQLRMPLIQFAIALMYGRQQDRTEVGFQNLDAGNLVTSLYTNQQIDRARRKFMALGRIVRRIQKEARQRQNS
jgi:hypothetical protein